MTPPRSTADAAAPLHERLEGMAQDREAAAERIEQEDGLRRRVIRDAQIEREDAATLREAAAALRPPDGELGEVIAVLEDYYHIAKGGPVVIPTPRLRAALAHLRRLGQVEAERASWKRWTEQAEAKVAEALAWAVSRWKAEVENRPLHNIYHRPLDDTWRQVVRHFGGDDEALLGPRHDDLAPAPAAEGE